MARYMCIPFLYGFNTRAKTKVHRISFFAVIFFPILINVVMMVRDTFSIFHFLLAFSAMYTIYEIGYIYNDVFTTVGEKEPTQWLKKEHKQYVMSHYPILISCRIVFAAICVYILMKRSISNVGEFIIELALIELFFSFHNYFRCEYNVYTNGILQALKYQSILILFGNGSRLILHCIYILFEIVIVRTIEYGIRHKYSFKLLWGRDIDNLRIVYYTVLTAVTAFLAILYPRFIDFFLGSIYFLIYRLLCKLLTRSKSVSTSRDKQ